MVDLALRSVQNTATGLVSVLPAVAAFGSATAAMADSTPQLIIVTGSGSEAATGNFARVETLVGGTTIGVYQGTNASFTSGPNVPNTAQHVGLIRVQDVGVAETVAFEGGSTTGGGQATVNAQAWELTEVPEEFRPYNESPNDAVPVTTVAAGGGFTDVGTLGASPDLDAGVLRFTPPGSDPITYLVCASLGMAVGAGGEVHWRLTVDGTPEPGLEEQSDSAGGTGVHNGCVCWIPVTLTGGVQSTIRFQVAGVTSAVDVSRIRILAIEQSIFAQVHSSLGDGTSFTTPRGLLSSASGNLQVNVTDPGGSPVSVFVSGNMQVQNFQNWQVVTDPDGTPANIGPVIGRAVADVGPGAGDDCPLQFGGFSIASQSGAVDLGVEGGPSGGGAGAIQYGADVARVANAVVRLTAVVMDVTIPVVDGFEVDSTLADTSTIGARSAITVQLNSTLADTSTIEARAAILFAIDSTLADTSTIEARDGSRFQVDSTFSDTSTIGSNSFQIDSIFADNSTVEARSASAFSVVSTLVDNSTIDARVGFRAQIESDLPDTSTLDARSGARLEVDSVLADTSTIAVQGNGVDSVLADTSTIGARSGSRFQFDSTLADTSTINAAPPDATTFVTLEGALIERVRGSLTVSF